MINLLKTITVCICAINMFPCILSSQTMPALNISNISILPRNGVKEKVLSRTKRYLIFPTGSSFSVATCSTIGIYGKLLTY